MKPFSKRLLKAENEELLEEPTTWEEDNRGQKEISKYDPEYEWLVQLVKVVSQAAPEAIYDIKNLSLSQPFVTVDDVGDLASKIWTLATEKYNIPREWLIKKLPEKKANINKTAADEGFWIDPAGKVYKIRDDKTDFQTHNKWISNNRDLLKNKYGINPDAFDDLSIADQNNILIDQGWVRIGDSNRGSIGMRVKDLRHIPSLAEDILFSFYSGGSVSIEDLSGKFVNIDNLDEDLQKAVNKQLQFKNADLDAPPCICGCKLKDHYFAGTPEEFYKFCAPDCMKYRAQTNKKADLWPAQEASENTLTQAPGAIAFNNPKDTTVSGPRPEDVEKVSKNKRKKLLNIDRVIQILNSKDKKVVHLDPIKNTIELADGSILSFDEATNKAMEMDKTSLYNGYDPMYSNDFHVTKDVENGPYDSPEDYGATPQEGQFTSIEWMPYGTEDEDVDPDYVSPGTLKANLSKKANPDKRYWYAPDGTEFPVAGVHGKWIEQNPDILKQYGIKPDKNLFNTWLRMKQAGWVRVSNEPSGSGFQIEVNDINRLPSFVDDIVAKYFTEGDTILVGNDSSAGVSVTEPFPSLQKAVNKQLRQSKASLKQADLSGNTINDILINVESSGGVTYNMSKGNLSGTPNYAVSIYPQNSKIIDGPVDFDTLEGFVEDNQSLLSDPNNSLGVWSNNGKTYLDVVVTIPDRNKAIELAKQHNQIAIWDLQNSQEINTGGTGEVRSFSKKLFTKTASESILPQDQQDEIASLYGPVMNIALNDYATSVKQGHDPERALAYAVDQVSSIGVISESDLKDCINTYLIGLI